MNLSFILAKLHFMIAFDYCMLVYWDKCNLLIFFSRARGDTYYCMLFNDEVHTYEQVIYTLQKAVNCTQKEAVSFATTVDRDVSSPQCYVPQCHNSGLRLSTACSCFCSLITSDRCIQGRKSVRFGDFQFCEQAKSVIVVSPEQSHIPSVCLRCVKRFSFLLFLLKGLTN